MRDSMQLSVSPPEEDEAFRERIIAGQSVQVKVIPPKESKHSCAKAIQGVPYDHHLA